MDAKILVSSEGTGRGTCFTIEFNEKDISLATA
jgi:hypothetical protein